jgi:hypothetical protein
MKLSSIVGAAFLLLSSGASTAYAADNSAGCKFPEGYICHDGLVFRPNMLGPWFAFREGDGRAPQNYAANACAKGDFLGLSGWRLPTEKELLSLVNSSSRPKEGTKGWRINGGVTWTSTQGSQRGYFRYVSMRLDMIDNGEMPGDDPRQVSCVRPI